jgi:crotonobetainyl-CoA:carnitine CoA-transferase CaiB-like acyl-CoA transferase
MEGRLGHENTTPGPLSGIRVVEMSSWLALPSVGLILGECGADVIKVERPNGGDSAREAIPAPGMRNYIFDLVNRNKRSIAVDVSTPDGLSVLTRLTRDADIFLTNYLPTIVDRLGISYESLSRVNPRLIYGWITGYGLRGEERNRPGFDPVSFWARSGMMSIHGEPGEPAVSLEGSFGDLTTGMTLVAGVMTALYERERTGSGQLVSTSLLGAGVWVGAHYLQQMLSTGVPRRRLSRTARNPLRNTYVTADGRWVQLVMPQGDRYWPRLCEALGLDDLANDPQFSTFQERDENADNVIRILDSAIRTLTFRELKDRFDKHELVWDVALDVEEVCGDRQVIDNEYIVSLDVGDGKVEKVVGIPFKFDAHALRPRRRSPRFGEHTEEVLLESGYTQDSIDRLREQRVIQQT